jgi:hypothetical protein
MPPKDFLTHLRTRKSAFPGTGNGETPLTFGYWVSFRDGTEATVSIDLMPDGRHWGSGYELIGRHVQRGPVDRVRDIAQYYAGAPIAIVTKLGTRQSRFTHSSASEASQISSRVSIASPTGRSCLTNNTPGLRRRRVNCRKMLRHGLEIMGDQNPPFIRGERQHLWIRYSVKSCGWRNTEVHLRFPADRPADDSLSEIIVGLIQNLHRRGSETLRRARSSRACKSGLAGVPWRSNSAHCSLRCNK